MTFVVYLVLMVSMTPVPQFAVISKVPTMQECRANIVKYTKENNLTKEQAALFDCLPVITSPMQAS